MSKKRVMIGLVLLILMGVFALTGFARAAGTPTIEWWAIGGGGGSSQSGSLALDGTIGQTVVGGSSSNDIELCSGFWGCSGVPTSAAIYLPLVVKSN